MKTLTEKLKGLEPKLNINHVSLVRAKDESGEYVETIDETPIVDRASYDLVLQVAIELASACQTCVGFEPFNSLEPRRLSEALETAKKILEKI